MFHNLGRIPDTDSAMLRPTLPTAIPARKRKSDSGIAVRVLVALVPEHDDPAERHHGARHGEHHPEHLDEARPVRPSALDLGLVALRAPRCVLPVASKGTRWDLEKPAEQVFPWRGGWRR